MAAPHERHLGCGMPTSMPSLPLQGSAVQTIGHIDMRAAIVSLGGEIFTIDLQNVREVFVVESITPVPRMPSGLVGVTNLRGSVIPLLDLGR